MTSRIAVLGATGVYARHLIPRLVSRGHKVRALVRRPEAAGVANACGAEIVQSDIFDEASLCAGLQGCDIAINLATSLPGPSGRGDFGANDHLRRHGIEIWIEACRNAGVNKVVQQSIAIVNAGGGDVWSDEDTVFTAQDDSVVTQAIAASVEMENKIRASGLDFVILRGALFYGPGTGLDDEWIARSKIGKLRLPGDGDDYVSFVHIADMAAATLAVISHWPSQQTLIIADDNPQRWRDVFAFLAALTDGPNPERGGQLGFPSFRVRNQRACEVLSWRPLYTDFRLGMTR